MKNDMKHHDDPLFEPLLDFICTGPTPTSSSSNSNTRPNRNIPIRTALSADAGRSAFAVKRIEPGESLAEISLDAVIDPRKALNELLDRTSSNNNSAEPLPLSEHQILALFLLFQFPLGTVSLWHPYIATLPDSFPTHPLNYTPELLDIIPSCFRALDSYADGDVYLGWREKVESMREHLLDDWEACCDFLKTAPIAHPFTVHIPRITQQTFLRGWLCVNTRVFSFGLPNDTEVTMAMVPLLDALNHSSVDTVKNTWDWEQGLYRMRTLVPYDAGEEVFNHYEDHSNAFLLAEYGFTIPANPSDEIFVDDVFWSLDVGAAAGHPTPEDQGQARQIILGTEPGSDKDLSFDSKGRPSAPLLQALHKRVSLLRHGELPKGLWSAKERPLLVKLARELAKRVRDTVNEAVEKAERYRQGVQEDGFRLQQVNTVKSLLEESLKVLKRVAPT